ncbi:hypothetical protein [Legionella gresilensis]|uniref:hypothetical protein n=1 Tax=Legionella gresilensis TaxID=91823 RepID=UPI001F5F52CF|nr:hypothetical protein [Legionella gresilensis]
MLQRIKVYDFSLTRESRIALEEMDPRKRACYGIEVGLPSNVPSLLRLSLFNLKKKLIQDNQGQLRSFNKDDLNGLEDLVPLINQHKI